MKTPSFAKRLSIHSILLLVLLGSLSAQQPVWLLNYNVLQGKGSEQLYAVLDTIKVQRVLLDIGIEPRSRDYVDAALSGTGYTAETLEDLDLIRCRSGVWTINFLMFPLEDGIKLRKSAEAHARILANAVLTHRAELEMLAKEYRCGRVDSRAAAYIALGCFSLDWDGLAFTAARGYRYTPSLFRKWFPRTVIMGWEPGEPGRKGYYKGSHNDDYAGITLTSFGDHELQPRWAFPDLLWGQKRHPDTLRELAVRALDGKPSGLLGERIARVMVSLRDGPKTMSELMPLILAGDSAAHNIITVLASLRYIDAAGGNYAARIPVFTKRDAAIVQRYRAIGREAMEQWFDNGYPALRDSCMALCPFKYGVSLEDYFYYIWHDVFGMANRMLVEEGIYADPYSDIYGGRGVIPTVFENEVYSLP